ncbi:UDP-3-O-(3-hydroxymyristoyl)glucosamine N-acyltransferase [Candidatus Tisiphia endosymbiont of Nedyus quadrimaculatus]|uniref:UDP-3-O-(3-hydroxymyristoyl)glucosamine N-acyltransferase n=1 Tax=Candidatus Tisiphia endosymbiont of Nedyus quadrimaculatus TaxID=3139332 RepID=UPI00345E5B1D
MINSRFYKKSAPYKLSEIVKLIDTEIVYSNDLLIHNVKSLEEANVGDISFLIHNKYIIQFQNTKASCCIVPENFLHESNNGTILLKTKNPYFAYAKLVDLFYSKAKTYPNKIMPSAYISDSATIGSNCYIGHNVVIEDHVIIGDNCIIESGTSIDFGVVIGNRALIYSNVSVSYSIIGDDVVILAGARIGQDGFGFATDKGIHKKILHTGMVKIGNNVEIGSNTTIDRGSINDTVIEDFCRIDNLVQIGHNAIIGRGSVIVAQAGIAGSTKVGAYCALGGQSGISGHIVLGDKVQVAAQSGVIKDVELGTTVGGYPAVPIRDWHKQSVIMKQLVNKKTGYR